MVRTVWAAGCRQAMSSCGPFPQLRSLAGLVAAAWITRLDLGGTMNLGEAWRSDGGIPV